MRCPLDKSPSHCQGPHVSRASWGMDGVGACCSLPPSGLPLSFLNLLFDFKLVAGLVIA